MGSNIVICFVIPYMKSEMLHSSHHVEGLIRILDSIFKRCNIFIKYFHYRVAYIPRILDVINAISQDQSFIGLVVRLRVHFAPSTKFLLLNERFTEFLQFFHRSFYKINSQKHVTPTVLYPENMRLIKIINLSSVIRYSEWKFYYGMTMSDTIVDVGYCFCYILKITLYNLNFEVNIRTVGGTQAFVNSDCF